jgi:hypothetical protein
MVLGRKDDALTRLQPGSVPQVPDPDARSLKIQQDRHGVTPGLEHGAELMNPARPDVGSAVGGVDSNHIYARIEQGGHLWRGVPGGSERSHDLGPADGKARHAGV